MSLYYKNLAARLRDVTSLFWMHDCSLVFRSYNWWGQNLEVWAKYHIHVIPEVCFIHFLSLSNSTHLSGSIFWKWFFHQNWGNPDVGHKAVVGHYLQQLQWPSPTAASHAQGSSTDCSHGGNPCGSCAPGSSQISYVLLYQRWHIWDMERSLRSGQCKDLCLETRRFVEPNLHKEYFIRNHPFNIIQHLHAWHPHGHGHGLSNQTHRWSPSRLAKPSAISLLSGTKWCHMATWQADKAEFFRNINSIQSFSKNSC